MILIVGGAFQGKKEYANHYYGKDYTVVDSYHVLIKEQLEMGMNPIERAESFLTDRKGQKLIILCDEVGSGVVPMKASERLYREMVGRVCCYFAKESSEVIRVVAGIGTKIKTQG